MTSADEDDHSTGPANPASHGEPAPYTADVCIVGGGPAGLMLSLLLARRGVRVVVLEKHGDFLRDFRGDTVHPSTLDLLDGLGLGADIDALPHRDVTRMNVTFADGTYTLADFTDLRVRHPYLRFMPQWHLLNLLAGAAEESGCTLLRSHEAIDLVRRDGLVTGVVVRTGGRQVVVRAYLTVAADGRNSLVRDRLALPIRNFGAPMDVLWFRMSRRPTDTQGLDMRVATGRLLLGIDRGDYWQMACVIPKGGYSRVRAAGLTALRAWIADLAPDLAGRVDEVTSWDDVKVLSVRLDRLRRWFGPGVLLIGDAAHAMSPIGGVGINLAVQDAVATDRLLAGPLLGRRLNSAALARVQRRRLFPTMATQLVQLGVQNAFLTPVLAADRPVTAPAPMRLLNRFPRMQRVPARLIGIGFLPEHLGKDRDTDHIPIRKHSASVLVDPSDGPR